MNQELIDYLNSQITRLDSLIIQKNQEKDQYDAAILQQQANITYFEGQKEAANTAIEEYNGEKVKINEIIALINV